jgi:hypothetical protein
MQWDQHAGQHNTASPMQCMLSGVGSRCILSLGYEYLYVWLCKFRLGYHQAFAIAYVTDGQHHGDHSLFISIYIRCFLCDVF